jgi:transcriptional regulator with XRE-family HTH domain
MDRTGEEAIKRRFGARMRELRKARGQSQEALAFACGLDRSYLGAIERGEKNVSLINICRIAEALGVGAAEMFAR